jgi:hypothetical protein
LTPGRRGCGPRWIVAALLCVTALLAADGKDDLKSLAWIAGTFRGVVGGIEMEEYWTTPEGGVMLGLHRDTREGKLLFFEYLRIEATDDGIDYIASPRGGESTHFRLVEQGERRAVFSNPDHDFPQRIIYSRDGDTLCARIEGKEGEQTRSKEWCWQRE